MTTIALVSAAIFRSGDIPKLTDVAQNIVTNNTINTARKGRGRR